ncbi:uncharacterized protein N7496_005157 [Penicillium cataractarum]|uniref:Tim44-like domain-containing protein n=1 Tax=Penicillium cataractarum TaxID=2100454 RepID=A0A9W9SFN0_9EURO|nr:uncharacterized protein N7496_005157 [Penicillium cataractarum]KAJ5377748.1 hypothetical protein N7496_005157 [Penicillium cataractarum]
MASSLRLPAGSIFPNARPISLIAQSFASGSQQQQCRAFSAAAQRWAYRSQNFKPASPAQPSMKSRAKDVMKHQLPNDIGLLPGTFVRPMWRDMPSIFQEPRDRLRMEWTWLKSVFQGYASVLVYCKKDLNNVPFIAEQMQKPHIGSIALPFFKIFHSVSRRSIAKTLYTQMYTNLAEGNTTELRRICCEKLAQKLTSQVQTRPTNEKVTWDLVGNKFSSARVMADRAVKIPDMPNSGIRQIVVRLSSRQSMTKTTIGRNASNEVVPAAKVQDCVEYVVIQQLIWHGKYADWQIWGTTRETDMHTLNTDPAFAPGLSALERLEAMKNMGPGGRL